jgi:hypothetical protein
VINIKILNDKESENKTPKNNKNINDHPKKIKTGFINPHETPKSAVNKN